MSDGVESKSKSTITKGETRPRGCWSRQPVREPSAELERGASEREQVFNGVQQGERWVKMT